MNKTNLILLFILFMVMLNSCSDFLEENPETIVPPDKLLTSQKGIEQAANGIYDAATSLYTIRYYYLMYDLPTDNIHYLGTNTSRVTIENFNETPTNGNVLRAWRTYYNGVTRANSVLKNIPENFNVEAFKNRSIGEAKFLRAWNYFGLVRTFGPVPLVTVTHNPENPERSSVADVYKQIIQDLKDAQDLLPSWTSYGAGDKGRASEGAAKGLLAKVYLTRASTAAAQPDDYENAAKKANEVIQSGKFGLIDNYAMVFRVKNENGKESLFAGQCIADSNIRCSHYTDMGPPENEFGAAGYNNFNITKDLFNAFEPGSERLNTILRGTFVTTTGDTVNTYDVTDSNGLYSNKYKDPQHQQRANEGTNFPFMRYSEVLLIYAEAENEVNGPTPQAYTAINKVRNRAGLSNLSGLTKDQFRKAAFHERRVELYFEGDRWFDLKRSKTLKEKVEAVKPDITVPIPKAYLFPIPQRELDVNKNLTQNKGYGEQ